MTSFDQPWQPDLDWSAPAGKDYLIIALRRVADIFRPPFDEESVGNPAHNTQILWRELFNKPIDVRNEIIEPALAERRRNYGDVSGLKSALSKIKPS